MMWWEKNLQTLPSSPRQTDSPRDQCPLLTCWLHAQQGRAWSSLALFKFGLIGSPTGWEDNLACMASHIFIAPPSLEQRLWLGGCGHLSSKMPWDYLSMSWVPLITQERATDPVTVVLNCLQSCGSEEKCPCQTPFDGILMRIQRERTKLLPPNHSPQGFNLTQPKVMGVFYNFSWCSTKSTWSETG